MRERTRQKRRGGKTRGIEKVRVVERYKLASGRVRRGVHMRKE